jgi:hypothetical protein
MNVDFLPTLAESIGAQIVFLDRQRGQRPNRICFGQMEKDLFAIFPDFPVSRPTGARVPPLVPSIPRRHPPTTHVARRRIPVNRHSRALRTARADHAPLRIIRQIAQTQYERLPPRTKTSSVGRVLLSIVEIADAAMRVD